MYSHIRGSEGGRGVRSAQGLPAISGDSNFGTPWLARCRFGSILSIMVVLKGSLHSLGVAASLLMLSSGVHAAEVPRIAPRLPELRPIRTIPKPDEEVVYYRKPKPYRSFDLRLAPGAVAHGGSDLTWSFGGDAVVAGRLGWGRGQRHLGIWPELGYAGHFEDSPRHAALVQVGVGSQHWKYQYGLMLGGTVPFRGEQTGVAARATAVLELWRGGIGLSAGYDAFPEHNFQHAFRLGVSIGVLHAVQQDGGKL